MKKLLLILFITSIFACNNKKPTLTNVRDIEQKELKSGVKNDSIFIGFKFGMTEEQVNAKFTELLNTNKITLDNRTYVYTFKFDYPEEAKATFNTNYFNNKLYEFILRFDADSQTTAELIQLKMVNLFKQKYGSFIKVPNILVETENDYVFINGNRKIKIEFPVISTCFVSYIDLSIKEENDKAKLEEKGKAEKKAISDI